MRKHLLLLAFCCISALLIFSCRQQFEAASWDVDLLLPLAEGRLKLEDIVEDDRLVTDSRRLFRLVFEEEVFRIGLDSLIAFPDTTISETYAIPIGGLFIYGGLPFQNDLTETSYKLNDVQLLEAIVQSSEVEVRLRNTLDARMFFRYTIHSAELDGLVFQVEDFVEPNSTLLRNYTLDGYTLDMTGQNGNKTNTLTTEVMIMLDPADSAYQLQAGDQFSIDNTFQSIIPAYARGYFGDRSFKVTDSSPIEGFEQIPSGMIDFTEFDVSLDITNRVGADLGITVNSLASTNALDLNTAGLNHPTIGNQVLVGRGTYRSLDSVDAQGTAVTFTGSNSNLDELIELRPDQVNFDINLKINPFGNVSLGNDFVVYGQDLTADLRIDVPLIVGLEGLMLVDTIAFNFMRQGENDPLNQVNAGFVRIHVNNAYPVEAGLQFYLQDAEGVIFDSLFAEKQWVESALLNVNGRLDQPAKSVLDIPVNASRFDQFEKAQDLRVIAILNSPEADSVSIFSDGYLDVNVVGDFNADTR